MANEIQNWINQAKNAGWSNEQIRQKLKESNYSDEQIGGFLNTKTKKKSNRILFIILSVIVSIIIISVIVYLALIGYFSHEIDEKKTIINAQISNLENLNTFRSNLIRDDALALTMKAASEVFEDFKEINGKYPESLDDVEIDYASKGSENTSAEDFIYTTLDNQRIYNICAEVSARALYGSTKTYEGPPTEIYCYDGSRHFTQQGDEYLKQYFESIRIGDDVKKDTTNQLVKPLEILVKSDIPANELTYTVFESNPWSYGGGLHQIEIKEDQSIKQGNNVYWIRTSSIESEKFMVRVYYQGELMTEINYPSAALSPVEAGQVEAL